MARKLIPADKKVASILRVLQEGRTVDEERRRLGVAAQTMHRFVNDYAKKYPEADKRPKSSELPPPPPADPTPAAPAAPSPEVPPPSGNTGMIDAAAVKAAWEADGGKDLSGGAGAKPGAAGSTPPPPPHQISLSTVEDDMAIVEGAANQVNGLACRGMIFLREYLAGVQISKDDMERIQRLFVMTDTERAMLKPASRHIALKLREWIGDDANISLGVGGSTILQGLWDRTRAIGEAVGRAVQKKLDELTPEEREELEKRMKGGAA